MVYGWTQIDNVLRKSPIVNLDEALCRQDVGCEMDRPGL